MTGLSWIANAYILAFGGFLLLGARLGDIFGRRSVFMTGLLVFGAASLAGGTASDASVLVPPPRRPGAGGRTPSG
ncbi:hypothetical protein [Streptomyces sp. NPDC050538]|uniref:hypothetical protein n=1 Tax=Streptomyces sp. NPDC050538 TaxID=3365627 RepID=UPI0037B0EA9D